MEFHCLCGLGVGVLAGHDHAPFCERGFGVCDTRCAESEYFLGRFSGDDVHRLFGVVAGHPEYLVQN